MISISGPISLMIAAFITWKCGQGKLIGVPLDMQEAKTITSAPHSTMNFTLVTALLPGQPPQLVKPVISTGPVFSNAPLPCAAFLKSVVPGHMSSVC